LIPTSRSAKRRRPRPIPDQEGSRHQPRPGRVGAGRFDRARFGALSTRPDSAPDTGRPASGVLVPWFDCHCYRRPSRVSGSRQSLASHASRRRTMNLTRACAILALSLGATFVASAAPAFAQGGGGDVRAAGHCSAGQHLGVESQGGRWPNSARDGGRQQSGRPAVAGRHNGQQGPCVLGYPGHEGPVWFVLGGIADRQ